MSHQLRESEAPKECGDSFLFRKENEAPIILCFLHTIREGLEGCLLNADNQVYLAWEPLGHLQALYIALFLSVLFCTLRSFVELC